MFELKAWLIEHNIQKDNRDLDLFLDAIDRNKDKQINLTEFFEFILEELNPKEVKINNTNNTYTNTTNNIF